LLAHGFQPGGSTPSFRLAVATCNPRFTPATAAPPVGGAGRGTRASGAGASS
jgi:hypothetical protein